MRRVPSFGLTARVGPKLQQSLSISTRFILIDVDDHYIGHQREPARFIRTGQIAARRTLLTDFKYRFLQKVTPAGKTMLQTAQQVLPEQTTGVRV
jgi:hypothetical protein